MRKRLARSLPMFVLLLAVALGCPPPGWAQQDQLKSKSKSKPQPKPDPAAERVRAEIEELQAQVVRRRESPDAPADWKEFQRLNRQLDERSKECNASERPLANRVRELRGQQAASSRCPSVKQIP